MSDYYSTASKTFEFSSAHSVFSCMVKISFTHALMQNRSSIPRIQASIFIHQFWLFLFSLSLSPALFPRLTAHAKRNFLSLAISDRLIGTQVSSLSLSPWPPLHLLENRILSLSWVWGNDYYQIRHKSFHCGEAEERANGITTCQTFLVSLFFNCISVPKKQSLCLTFSLLLLPSHFGKDSFSLSLISCTVNDQLMTSHLPTFGSLLSLSLLSFV